ncbi:hypothetical protein IEQ34_021675 [Dendrobium chrysotoxum]|uniref:UDP-glucose 4-epimerase n=1 Tax=Dendrobium chrysotoxum TaxID=161865 RepID=A0AAV7G5J0_DENCH|nr:hypothetical protein IEQ34_021675 [Dendrobium chrysotoxum]
MGNGEADGEVMAAVEDLWWQPPPDVLNSGRPPPDVLNSTGPPLDALSSVEPPLDALSSAGPPPDALSSAGPPPDTLSSAGPPPDVLSSPGPPPDAFSSAGPPHLMPSTSPDHRLTPLAPLDSLSSAEPGPDALSSTGSKARSSTGPSPKAQNFAKSPGDPEVAPTEVSLLCLPLLCCSSCAVLLHPLEFFPIGSMGTKTILVTGGAGYIGSHTVLQLLQEGFSVVVVDNLDNSSEVAVKRVEELAGDAGKNLVFYQADLRDREALNKIFASTKFDAVIHFAGLKAVGESVQKPLSYYDNNLIGTITLLEVMSAHGCKSLVFSSSATVYGWPKQVPCTEEFPLSAANPYGRTKLIIEDICRDIQKASSDWKIMLLRYFNPIGAHPSGDIGEDPRGIPNNLMPYIQQVAVGRRPSLTVFGTDYNTNDGTGVMILIKSDSSRLYS